MRGAKEEGWREERNNEALRTPLGDSLRSSQSFYGYRRLSPELTYVRSPTKPSTVSCSSLSLSLSLTPSQVRERYTWDNVAKEVEKVYVKVVEEEEGRNASFFERCEEWCEGRRFVACVAAVIFAGAVRSVMAVIDWATGKVERAVDRDHLYNPGIGRKKVKRS